MLCTYGEKRSMEFLVSLQEGARDALRFISSQEVGGIPMMG